MNRKISWISALFPLLLWTLACGSDDTTDAAEDNSTSAASNGDAGASTGQPADATAEENRPGEDTPDASKPDASAAASCDDVSCDEPALCRMQDGRARCVCPEGYDDAAGDGSDCRDIDECADADSNDCDRHATCNNTRGAYECTCRGPAYEGDGKDCACADKFVERDGECLAPDGESCKDNLDCAHDHCVSEICCAQACDRPEDECHSVEGATCEDGQTCKYPAADDGTACEDGDACSVGSVCKAGSCQQGTQARDCDDNNPCTNDSCDATLGCKNENNTQACDDDNPCTQSDQCLMGMCLGKNPLDCSMLSDACNSGVCDPADGSCKLQPRMDGTACDDVNACTPTDRCKAGTCEGSGNACGPNATQCSAGMPNSCTCAAGFHESAGLCVPDNDECAANPCGANTDCFDPSNTAGDATCSCKAGYEGDAKQGCTATDPCLNNPCGAGRGTCTPTQAGKYSCNCEAGLREVAGQCVCDMTGTFAMRTALSLSWKDMDGIEDGSGSTLQWSIARQSYDGTGALELEIILCGETNLDLCGTGVRIAGIAPEAYSQYVPRSVWDRSATRVSLVDFELPAPVPGSAYKTPRYAMLRGISLTDPLGEWPPKRQDVQGGNDFDGSAVNGARWLDTDGDTLYGLTTYAVGPGGVAADDPLAPIELFGTTSAACPRSAPSAARLPYNYPPALDGFTPRRVKRFSSANRALSELDGTIDSCDEITGNVTGPDNGYVHYDLRIGSCVRSDDVACSASMLDFLDANQAPNAIDMHTFSMKRVQDDITCEQVRALEF